MRRGGCPPRSEPHPAGRGRWTGLAARGVDGARRPGIHVGTSGQAKGTALLEAIARKEQELRARLLAARAAAEAIIADGRRAAAELLAEEARRSESEAERLVEQEFARARDAARRLVARAEAEARALEAESGHLEAAVSLVVDAVAPVPGDRE